MFTIRLIQASVLAAGTLAAAWLARGLGSGPTVVLTGVQVLDDRLEPVDGAVARLRAGTQEAILLTDSYGQTPWASLDPSAGLELTLGEQETDDGILLGAIETVATTFVVDTSLDAYFAGVSRTQTRAVPVTIQDPPGGQAGSSYSPPDGDYPHWRIAAPPASGLRLTAHVASLLDAGAIDEFLAYRGHAPDPALGYVRGVVLVVPGVQLGSVGVAVGMDLLGDLPGGAAFDAYNFTDAYPFLVPAGPALDVQPLGTTNGVAFVQVTGGVAAGHLVLLARDAAGLPPFVRRLQDDPPSLVIPPNAASGVQTVMRSEEAEARVTGAAPAAPGSASAFVKDCDPPTPGNPSGWDCTPLPPDPSYCGAATPGAKQCKTLRWRSPLVCRDPGALFEATTIRTEKWKVKIELKSADGLPLSSAGGFEYGQESTTQTTDQWVAGPGIHGLGECMRFYKFVLVCAQQYLLQIDGIEFGSFGLETVPCGRTVTFNEGCTDTIYSQSTCSRTP